MENTSDIENDSNVKLLLSAIINKNNILTNNGINIINQAIKYFYQNKKLYDVILLHIGDQVQDFMVKTRNRMSSDNDIIDEEYISQLRNSGDPNFVNMTDKEIEELIEYYKNIVKDDNKAVYYEPAKLEIINYTKSDPAIIQYLNKHKNELSNLVSVNIGKNNTINFYWNTDIESYKFLDLSKVNSVYLSADEILLIANPEENAPNIPQYTEQPSNDTQKDLEESEEHDDEITSPTMIRQP